VRFNRSDTALYKEERAYRSRAVLHFELNEELLGAASDWCVRISHRRFETADARSKCQMYKTRPAPQSQHSGDTVFQRMLVPSLVTISIQALIAGEGLSAFQAMQDSVMIAGATGRNTTSL
jgi:hypothetical protein